MESFEHGADGSVTKISMSSQGPKQIGTFDPYVKVPATTLAFSVGLQDKVRNGELIAAFVSNGGYSELAGVAFGTGAKNFTASVASAKIVVRLRFVLIV